MTFRPKADPRITNWGGIPGCVKSAPDEPGDADRLDWQTQRAHRLWVTGRPDSKSRGTGKRRRRHHQQTAAKGEAMSISGRRPHAARKRVLMGMAAAIAGMMAGQVLARDDHGIHQSGEQKNMRRVGHVDLQGRVAYQPNVIVYPDGRTIAFVGTHNGSRPNPLKPGSPVEPNGTMIIDVTNPSRPVEKS